MKLLKDALILLNKLKAFEIKRMRSWGGVVREVGGFPFPGSCYVENVSVRANVSLACHTSQPRQHHHHRHPQHRRQHHQLALVVKIKLTFPVTNKIIKSASRWRRRSPLRCKPCIAYVAVHPGRSPICLYACRFGIRGNYDVCRCRLLVLLQMQICVSAAAILSQDS